ncbi:hypothetical protein AB0D04_42090 [Streptomyces sp. NPDC048483]|uniref:hypothetical protein n=1 Tax=Streptomyces sp. NPDC048483 TaxID=3154927 RepID=UPI00343134B0
MHVRTFRKLLSAVAATALASLALTAPAHAAPAPAAKAVPVGQPVLAVSQVTGNYLLPDDTKGNVGTYLQVYPSEQPTWNNQWQFDVVAYSDGRPVYQLKSSPGGACATDENGADSISYLRVCSRGNKGQWWLLTPVPGTDPQNPDYGIVSYVHEDVALTARGEGDNWVDLKKMWGGSPSARQGWHFYPA